MAKKHPAEEGKEEGGSEEAVKRKPAKKPAATPRGRAKKAPAAKAKKIPEPTRPNEVHVYDLAGKVVKEVDLPPVFGVALRTDLIRRAVTAFQANRRQRYGSAPRAGMRHSVRWSGKGHGVSRVPRIRGTMIGAQAPGTVGGRRAHPPRSRTDFSKKINEKERLKARNAALVALHQREIVSRRGHIFEDDRTLPLVVVDDLEEGGKDSVAVRGVEILKALGVWGDVERAARRARIRAGRGKMRGRRYRNPKSVLVVAAKPEAVARRFENLPGVDIVPPSQLNAELLAPGGDPGRLTIFTESALEALRAWST